MSAFEKWWDERGKAAPYAYDPSRTLAEQVAQAAFEAGAAQEREACAELAERFMDGGWAGNSAATNVIAAAIRARGEQR